MKNLTIRLEMVLDQVRNAAECPVRVIDVGSDHGYLALKCLEEGIAKSVVCTEIHEGPAIKSASVLNEAGFGNRFEVHVTDGLKGIPLSAGDIVVIAGMGGLNIIDIIGRALKDNAASVMEKVVFVLQPQKSNETVRKYLCDNGFVFEDECVCYDRDIFYNCMRVVYKGIYRELSDFEACYGPLLIQKKNAGDKNIALYFKHLDKIFEVRKRSNPTVRAALEEKKNNEC